MTSCCTPETVTAPEMATLKPRYTIGSEKDSYAVRIELPGVSRDNVNVQLDSNVLTVHAKRKSTVPNDWKTLHRELSDLDFFLRLKLNSAVDESKMTAKLDAGVLVLNLPLKEIAKPRRIEVG